MLRDVGPVLTNCMHGGTTAHHLSSDSVYRKLFLEGIIIWLGWMGKHCALFVIREYSGNTFLATSPVK